MIPTMCIGLRQLLGQGQEIKIEKVWGREATLYH